MQNGKKIENSLNQSPTNRDDWSNFAMRLFVAPTFAPRLCAPSHFYVDFF
jgi:hypothetical protein